MAVASTLRGLITADASGVEKAVSDAEQEMDGLAGRVESTGERMQSAGRKMTMGISAPLAAMGGMAIRQAGNFDQAMQQSIAVMGDVDEAMREDLEQTAREVAKSTTMSHQQAAESFYFLASAGLDAEQAMAAMPQVAAFAEAGQMDMAEATDVATNVMSAYGIEAENMADVTDVMTATVTNHNQTMEGMSAAFRNAAPAAASMGVEIEELAALTGALGDVGIQGAEAGTALNSMMRRMSKRSGEAGKALDELGIQTTDANGELLPLTDIIAQLEDANMSAAQSSAIFGRQMSAGNALVNAGADELRGYQSRLGDAEGATQNVAETQRDTLNAELAMTRSRLNDAAVTIGADVLPMVSTLAGHVGTAADAFAGLSDRQQKTVLALAGIVAVGGPAIWILGTLFTSASAVAGGFATASAAGSTLVGVLTGGVIPAALATQVALGPITVPIWAIIGAVGALIGIGGALYYAWTNNIFGIRDTTTDAFNTVKGWFQAAPDWLLMLIGPIGWLYASWRENLFGVQDIVGSVFDWIGDKIGWLIDKIQNIPGIGDEVDTSTEEIDDVAKPDDPGAIEKEWGDTGSAAGEEYAAAFEAGAASGTDDVTGEITDELLSEFSDEEIQDIFHAREVEEGLALHGISDKSITEASKEATITPEMLGISSQEFNALLGGGQSAGSRGSAPPADLMTQQPTAASGSSAPSAEDLRKAFGDALRQYFDEARLRVLLESSDRDLGRFVDERAEAVFQDVVNPR